MNFCKSRSLSMLPVQSLQTLNRRCYNVLVSAKTTRSLFVCTKNEVSLRFSRTQLACYNKLRHQRLSSSEDPFMRRTSNVNEDDIPPITLNNTIRMKNVALATVLLGFCFGIMWYSMHAVGQAGEKDDPLSALKKEAAAAQKKHDQEQATTANAADMLQKFQKGEFDPDHVPEEDEVEAPSKKPWWKVW